jgi:Tfp pilus assembly protein PilO
MKKQQLIVVVAGLAIVVVIVAWYAALWSPETSRLKTAQASEVQAAAQVSSAQAQVTQLRADQSKVAQEEALYRELVKAVPNGPSLDQMLRTINAAAKSAGITLTSVGTPEPTNWGAAKTGTSPTTGAGPASMSVTLGVEGGNAQVLGFVTALDKEPRLYVVNSFTLSTAMGGAASNGSNTATLQVETFFASAASGNPVFPG